MPNDATSTAVHEKLTITEANSIAERRLAVSICEVDPTLWQVGDPINEAHDPMTEEDWRTFLQAHIDVIPAHDVDENIEPLGEVLAAHVVAAIVSFVRVGETNNQEVDSELRWFADQLVTMLGGQERQTMLAEQIGV